MANIGISDGWEYFDRHTKTIEKSKQVIKAGSKRPVWELSVPYSYFTPHEFDYAMDHAPWHWDPDFGWLQGIPWDWSDSDVTNLMVSASVSYDSSGGASMVVVTNGRRWMGYEGFPIILFAGYGEKDRFDNMQPIFQGHIYDINDHPNGTTELKCYANAKMLGMQVLGKRLDFRNLTLAEAMRDVFLRTGHMYGFQMTRGYDFVIHDPEEDNPGGAKRGQGEFMAEATFLEVMQTLTDPAGYVGYDAPYGRIIEPDTDLRSSKFLVTNYKERDYPKNGFTFTPGQRGIYSRVAVYRRRNNTEGELINEQSGRALEYKEDYEVFADRKVQQFDRFEAPLHRWYMVPDFNGNNEEAQIEANRLARYYAETGGTFELECSLADFWLHDAFGLYRTEQRLPNRTAYLYGVPVKVSAGHDRVLAFYKCIVDEGVDFEISRGTFKTRLRGSAILANIAGVNSPARVSYRSTGLVVTHGQHARGEAPPYTAPPPSGPPPPTTVPWTFWGQDNVTFGELWDVTFADLT